MRTITVEKNLYTFEELSESAKERAAQKYNEFLWNDGEMHERMQGIADSVLSGEGMTPAERLEYSLYTQGGYPTFGTSGAHESAGDKYTFDRDTGNQLTVWNAEGVDLDEIWSSNPVKFERVFQEIRDRLYGLSMTMYGQMVEEDAYFSTVEQVAEASEANGWEYDEDGNLA